MPYKRNSGYCILINNRLPVQNQYFIVPGSMQMRVLAESNGKQGLNLYRHIHSQSRRVGSMPGPQSFTWGAAANAAMMSLVPVPPLPTAIYTARPAQPQPSRHAASVDGFWSVFCFTVAMSRFSKCCFVGFLCFYSKLRMHACKAACLFAFSCKCRQPLPQPPFAAVAATTFIQFNTWGNCRWNASESKLPAMEITTWFLTSPSSTHTWNLSLGVQSCSLSVSWVYC